MERYLERVSSIDLSAERKCELIAIVHSITAHFVDQAFGVQTDQLSLKSQWKSRFEVDSRHANKMAIPTIEPSALPLQGPGNDSNFGRPDVP
ncbi:hypothetical protein [uncultured Novosphingobium sp.]|uniref:hypothetical protein n=1 Tax=uncultured Novosphingobium sp. TaxID=292277 RepID=UPI002596747E|nr:hypothetical protein [uncultured Novosphingobium sp.]